MVIFAGNKLRTSKGGFRLASRAQCSANSVALGSMSLEDCMPNGGSGVSPQLRSGIGGRDDAIVCRGFREESSFHHQRLSRLKA